jgi:UDP-N-acetylmuramoyl-tripeptide--D-alanyl-D-alanine ligase
MIPTMTDLNTAAAALHGTLRGSNVEFSRVATDTRSIQPGDLFVALKGERFDGHSYAQQALDQGAVAVLVNSDSACVAVPAIVVADTRLALGQLAAWWRDRMPARIVGVTGSNGKTTVKEMLAAILSAASNEPAVLATAGNFNNDIGLPLTLLNLRPQHRFGVIEMGMNHAGEIDYLTRLARPDVALVNNAGAAHVGLLGSVEAVARAKGEIFAGLGEHGVAIINADDAHAALWRGLAADKTVLDFGLTQPAAVQGRYHAASNAVDVMTATVCFTPHLQVAGEHNARNALAATAAALALGVNSDAIVRGLAAFRGVAGRMQTKPALHGATLIDDSYNANPDSVRAALAVLATVAGVKILVLGDMAELGDAAEALHAEIGMAARSAGVNYLFALGDLSRAAVSAFGVGAMHFERIEELLAEVENRLAADVTVLVKGSRFMQMERVVKSFEVRH